MSYAPASLTALRDYLKGLTGLPAVSLGIVGNAAHVRGYHLGRDRIYAASGAGAADYSVRTPRDRSGLSNAAMAMDIGAFSSHGGLRHMSTALVARCRRGTADTRDIREVIYSPDGVQVLRWDRERGITSTPRPGEADNSHRTHTHVSWYRDSEARAKVPAFAAILSPVPVPPAAVVWWASTIAADIKAAYTAPKVAAKLKSLGVPKYVGFGSPAWGRHALTYSDLEAGLRVRGINYGTSVQLIDVRALMRPGKGT
jgi:hypothetical protein